MTPERKKVIFLVLLTLAMMWALPEALIRLSPDATLDHKLILVVLVLLIIFVTWGFGIRATGEYQKKSWLSEAQDARARGASATRPEEAAPTTPSTDSFTPQPLGFGVIALASVVATFVVTAVAQTVLSRESAILAGIIGLAVGFAVLISLQERRKRQILRQADLDKPSPEPFDKGSV